ncbi:MAG: hypothetical protein ABSD44_13300 [Terracidiphilus sp.]
MRTLRAIGIDSSPELHELWVAFLHDHSGENEAKGVMQCISGELSEPAGT